MEHHSTLTIRRWRDGAPGHPVAGDYAERFWLPVVGPTGMWLMRWAARELSVRGAAFDVADDELAQRLGLGCGTGRNSPIRRSLRRLERFELTRRPAESVVEFRTTVPRLDVRRVERLPGRLRLEHRWWLDDGADERAPVPATAGG